MNPMKNKRVLITGGTSGLGRELALELAIRGARVAIVGRNGDRLEEVIEKASPLGVIGIQADVSDKKAIYRIAAEAHARLGGVDFLVNSASYLGQTPLRSLLDTECEDLSRVIETNLIGPFRLTKALLPGMLLSKSGTILNISSDAAVNAYPHWGSYSASKAALTHLTRVWAEELRDKGIRFFAVDPGDMDTPMHAAAIPNADISQLATPREAALRLLENIVGEGNAL